MENSNKDIREAKKILKRRNIIDGFIVSFFKKTMMIYAIILINFAFPEARESILTTINGFGVYNMFNLNQPIGILFLGFLTLFSYKFINEFAKRAIKKDNGEYMLTLFLMEKTFIIIPILFLFLIFTN